VDQLINVIKNHTELATSYGLGVLNDIIESGEGKIELLEDNDKWESIL